MRREVVNDFNLLSFCQGVDKISQKLRDRLTSNWYTDILSQDSIRLNSSAAGQTWPRGQGSPYILNAIFLSPILILDQKVITMEFISRPRVLCDPTYEDRKVTCILNAYLCYCRF